MKFNVLFKLNADAPDWTTIILDHKYFNENWDKDEILSDIFEHVYAQMPEGSDCDDRENVIIKDFNQVTDEIHDFLNGKVKSAQALEFEKDLASFEAADRLN
jgi:hypothetical protein